jgi:pyrroloquinoline quinone (PQQ) biosynthesis protein C
VEKQSTRTFIEEIQEGLRVPGRWLPGHPVIEKLERKELSRAQIAGMMTQIYRQTCEVVRWFGYLYAKCPVMAVRREIFNNLMEEELGAFSGTEGHFHLAARVAVAAGADPRSLDRALLLPATADVIRLGEQTFYENPNWIVAFGTAFGFEYQSPMMFGALARALKTSYGMSDRDVEFFSVHVTADEDHTGAIVRVLDVYATSDEDRGAVRDAALSYAECYHRMLSTYEAFA